MTQETRPIPGFKDLFGSEPRLESSALTPIRLMGLDDDGSDGLILSAAFPVPLRVQASRGKPGLIRGFLESEGELVERAIGAPRDGSWLDAPAACIAALLAEDFPVEGLDLRLSTTLSLNSGRPRPALDIAILRALRDLYAPELEERALAFLAQRAEEDHRETPCGLSGPLSCALAEVGSALFLDTRSLAVRTIPLFPEHRFMVIEGGAASRDAALAGEREAECEEASQILGLPSLRELNSKDLAAANSALEPLLMARVRHVVSSNDRVEEAAAALVTKDALTFGCLMVESQGSLRDDFEFSTAELDRLVDCAMQEGAEGARGTGSGGAVVALVPEESCEAWARAMLVGFPGARFLL